MSVVVITPPPSLVSLALAKAHLRVEHDDDDDLIQLAIDAASGEVDGPDGWLQRAVGDQVLELRLDSFDPAHWLLSGGSPWRYAWEGGWNWCGWPFRGIRLPCPPVVQVQSITFETPTGVDQMLSPDGWVVDGAAVEPAYGAGWPIGRVAANAVRIRYRAGYPDTPPAKEGDAPVPTIPARIRSAVLLRVEDLYTNRSANMIDSSRGSAVENPTLQSLLGPFRVYA